MAKIENALDSLSPELRAKAEQMKKARGLTSLGFYEELMLHPSLFEKVEQLGSMLRFHGLLPGKLREAAILMAGVEQQNVFEWQTHQKTARAAGLTEEEIFSIGTEGTLDAELTRVRDIVLATIQDRSVAQGRFDEFAELHGLAAAVELVTLAAFYRMMSGLGSAFESAMSGGEPPPWQSAE